MKIEFDVDIIIIFEFLLKFFFGYMYDYVLF